MKTLNQKLKNALIDAWEIGSAHERPTMDQLNRWRELINTEDSTDKEAMEAGWKDQAHKKEIQQLQENRLADALRWGEMKEKLEAEIKRLQNLLRSLPQSFGITEKEINQRN